MCFPLASQIERVANSPPDARSQRGRVPEPEFDGLLLAARTRGAVRVRPKPRLTLDAHFRAVATGTSNGLVAGALRVPAPHRAPQPQSSRADSARRPRCGTARA